jgi:hypothetical protein
VALGLALSALARLEIYSRDRETGNLNCLASARIPAVLEMEEPSSTGATVRVAGGRQSDRKMCSANPYWGAPRIHGELLKLGFELSQATVAKYMLRRQKPPSQTWLISIL